jgi:hypothetical protein
MFARLFCLCYKLGVNDAYALNDEGLCRQNIENTKRTGYFGRVGDDIAHDALYWQLRLKDEVYRAGFYYPFDRYLLMMGRFGRNYLSVAIVIAQDFYNKGVADYCDHASSFDIEHFNATSRAFMMPKGNIQSISGNELIERIQLMTFVREHADTNGEAVTPLKPHQYDLFRRCVGIAMRPKGDWMYM